MSIHLNLANPGRASSDQITPDCFSKLKICKILQFRIKIIPNQRMFLALNPFKTLWKARRQGQQDFTL